MKRLRKLLAPALALGAAFAVVPTVTSCAGEGAYVVASSPPPPYYERYAYRPGYVWVHGHWLRDRGDWRWRRGYYVRERPGYVYRQPRWERRGGGYVYVRGEWRPRSRVQVYR